MPLREDFLPDIYTHHLPNQMKIVGMEYSRTPWVSITFMAKRGSEADPRGKGGTADCLAECLTLGTQDKDQLELASTIEGRGAMLNAHGTWDHILIKLEGLAEDFSDLMGLLAEIVLQPGFPEQDFAFLRERRQAELIHYLDDPREVANRTFLPLFFGDSPYGHPVDGSLESLAALSLSDLQSFYHDQFHPGESSLVIVGMVPETTAMATAERLWAKWSPSGQLAPPFQKAPETLCAPGVYLLDQPNLTQSEIRCGHLGLPAPYPGFLPPAAHELYPGGRWFFLPVDDAHPGRKRLYLRHPEPLSSPPGAGALYYFHLYPGRAHCRSPPGNQGSN